MTRLLIPAVGTRPVPAAGPMLSLDGATMGTTWSVKAIGEGLDADVLRAGVQARLDAVVAQMSPWEADSDLSRFNAASAGAWLPLPTELYAVLDHGMALARDSGGAFDPCVGALVDLWGFGPPPAPGAPPADAAIEAARAAGGYHRLTLDPAVRGARQPGGLRLDLSGIAKGYGADQAADYLGSAGAQAYLVEVGGELVGRGVKGDGQPWWVALETPPGLDLEPAAVALHELAIATSGDYQRFFHHDGRSYPHTLDPRTGSPVTHNLASVSVLHASCMAADALATALMVLGPEAGLAFAEARGLAARLVLRTNSGPVEQMTAAMRGMLD